MSGSLWIPLPERGLKVLKGSRKGSPPWPDPRYGLCGTPPEPAHMW